MRTTLTLDDDVAASLKRLQESRSEAMRETVNTVLRAGLAALAGSPRQKRSTFRTPTVSLGKPRLANLDDVASVLAFAEGEDHR